MTPLPTFAEQMHILIAAADAYEAELNAYELWLEQWHIRRREKQEQLVEAERQ